MGIGEAVLSFAVMFSSLLFPILVRNPIANLVVFFLSFQISYELIYHFGADFFVMRGYLQGVPFRDLLILIYTSIVVWGLLIFRGFAKFVHAAKNRLRNAQ